MVGSRSSTDAGGARVGDEGELQEMMEKGRGYWGAPYHWSWETGAGNFSVCSKPEGGQGGF